MTESELTAAFESLNDDFLKFKDVQHPRSTRPDLHAFLLLDALVPDTRDMVSGAGHDEIWLGVDVARLALVITREQVHELVRCGVRLEDDSLCMFA